MQIDNSSEAAVRRAASPEGYLSSSGPPALRLMPPTPHSDHFQHVESTIEHYSGSLLNFGREAPSRTRSTTTPSAITHQLSQSSLAGALPLSPTSRSFTTSPQMYNPQLGSESMLDVLSPFNESAVSSPAYYHSPSETGLPLNLSPAMLQPYGDNDQSYASPTSSQQSEVDYPGLGHFRSLSHSSQASSNVLEDVAVGDFEEQDPMELDGGWNDGSGEEFAYGTEGPAGGGPEGSISRSHSQNLDHTSPPLAPIPSTSNPQFSSSFQLGEGTSQPPVKTPVQSTFAKPLMITPQQKNRTSTGKPSHARKTPPGHIKRPRNAYILYRSHVCTAGLLPESLAIKDHRQVSMITANMWKNLPRHERKVFEDLAEKEKAEHRKNNPEYKYRPNYRREGSVRRRKRVKDAEEGEEEARKCEVVARILMEKKGSTVQPEDVEKQVEEQRERDAREGTIRSRSRSVSRALSHDDRDDSQALDDPLDPVYVDTAARKSRLSRGASQSKKRINPVPGTTGSDSLEGRRRRSNTVLHQARPLGGFADISVFRDPSAYADQSHSQPQDRGSISTSLSNANQFVAFGNDVHGSHLMYASTANPIGPIHTPALSLYDERPHYFDGTMGHQRTLFQGSHSLAQVQADDGVLSRRAGRPSPLHLDQTPHPGLRQSALRQGHELMLISPTLVNGSRRFSVSMDTLDIRRQSTGRRPSIFGYPWPASHQENRGIEEVIITPRASRPEPSTPAITAFQFSDQMLHRTFLPNNQQVAPPPDFPRFPILPPSDRRPSTSPADLPSSRMVQPATSNPSQHGQIIRSTPLHSGLGDASQAQASSTAVASYQPGPFLFPAPPASGSSSAMGQNWDGTSVPAFMYDTSLPSFSHYGELAASAPDNPAQLQPSAGESDFALATSPEYPALPATVPFTTLASHEWIHLTAEQKRIPGLVQSILAQGMGVTFPTPDPDRIELDFLDG